MIFRSFLSAVLFLFFTSSVFAALPFIAEKELTVRAKTGDTVWLPVKISIPDGAYVYGNPKGPGTGKALSVRIFSDSQNLNITPLINVPEKYRPADDDLVFIYRKSLTLSIPFSASATERIQVKIEGLMCTDSSCSPFSIEKKFTLLSSANSDSSLKIEPSGMVPLGSEGAADINVTADKKNTLAHYTFAPRFLSLGIGSILAALFFGFLAGLLLNLMPCVLPVLVLKVVGIVQNSHDRKRTIESGFFYAAGIMIFFSLISLLIIFTGYRWGSFFQSSSFLIIVILILIAFSLSLLGLFTLPVPSFLAAGSARKNTSLRIDSFSKGFFAALLATPCSGPFLGAVLAWALTQTGIVIFAVFISIGAGLAAPYFALTLFPSLVRFIPRPGGWTIIFEKVLGLLLLVSAVYFSSILNTAYYIPVTVMAVISAAGLWQFGRWGNPLRSTSMRRISFLILILTISAALYFPLKTVPSSVSSGTNAFSLDSLIQTSSSGKVSVVVFTADWCPNCKLVEKTVLHSDAIQTYLKNESIAVFYADITVKGTEGEDLLKSLGGTAIPFLAVFPAGNKFYEPVCLRDIYTKKDLIEAIDAASK
jgi:thiol:disulfide interchange protein DsbD